MGRKISNAQRRQVVADRAMGMSFRKLAEKYNVSQSAIVKIVKSNPDLLAECTQKRYGDAKDVLDYMNLRKVKAMDVLDLAFDALNDPIKFQKASVQSIATMMGIIIDKYAQLAQLTKSGGISNELLESLLTLEREAKKNGD